MFINVYFLYKNQFSPIRTWLDPRIRKTKSNLKNSVQGSDEAQQHDYNFDTTNMDFNRYNYNDVSSFKEYKSIFDRISGDEMTSATELCGDIISGSIKYSDYDVKNICPSVMNYLNKLQMKTDDSYKVKGCKYLYYALYEMAQEKNIPNDITYTFYKDLLKTYHLKKGYKFHVNIENLNSDTFKTIKNLLSLHDYFSKYEKKSQCHGKVCDCAEECVKIYNEYIEKCNKHYSSSLCTELNKFAEKFNKHLNQDNECKGKITKLETFNGYNLEIIILIPIILIFVISFLFIILYKVKNNIIKYLNIML
ncbi:hypothetical protein PVNG_05945 [Plasmodium vivax North Korean]|uniref:Variable surface protein n=1 Tax=Plasmodium vivax North Korean TaxID=1035514 RepID=A0A0J9TLR0_PLAVI|nr:hypothetical protein PVNG_05945 [Plasmodium vivax North Korean]